jgi:serine/threonine-protein kinase
MNNDVAAGTVLNEDPPPGTSLPKDSTVTLTVSAGPAPFPMPAVVGSSCASARNQLQAAGLVVTVTSRSGGCSSNAVLEQLPLATVSVKKGDPVTIFVP